MFATYLFTGIRDWMDDTEPYRGLGKDAGYGIGKTF